MSGPGEKKQLGRILLKQKLVTPEELQDLLERQRSDPAHRLASHALAAGRVRDVDLLKALSEQHGLPGIDLAQVVIPLANLALLPVDIAKQHLILPVVVRDDQIFLAMADPADRRVIDEVEFVTGRRVCPYVALSDALREVIDSAYQSAERGEEFYIGPRAPAEYVQRSVPAELPPAPSMPLDADDDDELSRALPVDPAEPAMARRTPSSIESLDPAFDSKVVPMPAPDEEGVASQERPTVLVVDDEDDIRRLLRRVLQDKGFEVVEARKGLEALQMVRAHVPHVILLDAMLPEVHGFDICRRIKGSKRYGHIPIIMVSAIYRGWRFAEDLRQSYGVDAFLEKPFKIGDVVAAVQRAVEGKDLDAADALEEDLSRDAGLCLQQGIEAYQRGEFDAAVEHLRDGIGIDPLSFKLHYHLGLLYGRREDTFEAIHELETAVTLQPKHFSSLKNLAVLYQKAGFKHKAIEMWERALGNAPDADTRQGIKEHLMSLL